MIKKISILIFIIFYSFQVFAADYTRGKIMSISTDMVKLKLPHGPISYIGFSCVEEVCNSTKNFKEGDDVLITLGAKDRKNALLAIRTCSPNDKECADAKAAQDIEAVAREKQSKLSAQKHQACLDKMYANLESDKRYAPENSNEDLDEIMEEYNKQIEQGASPSCLEKVLHAHKEAVIESCQKFDCGHNIGGGCYDITGYSLTAAALQKAIKQCGI